VKTLKLNFEKWNYAMSGVYYSKIGQIRRSYNRVYIKGSIWTPLVIVTWIKTK